MRGALKNGNTLKSIERIIPADAGSTGTLQSMTRDLGDHPRGCGEHGRHLHAGDSQIGSSPRMRGARQRLSTDRKSKGIIPADAGSTDLGGIVQNAEQDHPRGCGEHSRACFFAALAWGSSPRMRGALVKVLLGVVGGGIIPADAGSTCLAGWRSPGWRDHPRGCGEHCIALHPTSIGSGSSPRMRGARRQSYSVGTGKGIIPADAGSTCSARLF